MKKVSLILIFISLLASCSNEKQSNLTIHASVEGLKKGTLFLQKVEDTSLINLDSMVADGSDQFTLKTTIDSPEMLYLYLEKVDNSKFDDRFNFFAEKGEMTISTSLEKFETDAKIKGSKNQEKLSEYKKMIKKFNNRNLELIKENFDAQKANNNNQLVEIDKKYESLLKRKYLYTVNFAMNNKDLEIAPYLALSEVFDANIKYLDTIYNSLNKNIKQSKYGKELQKFLQKRRKEESKQLKKDSLSIQ